MPLLAFNRKDTGGESIGGKSRHHRQFSRVYLKTLAVWRHRGRRLRMMPFRSGPGRHSDLF
jgi:hypothetical protein